MVFETIDAHLLVEGENDDNLKDYLKIIESLPNSKRNRLFIVPDSKPISAKTNISNSNFDYPYINHMVKISDLEYMLESMDFYQIISMEELDNETLNMCSSSVRDAVYLDEGFSSRTIVKRYYENRLEN